MKSKKNVIVKNSKSNNTNFINVLNQKSRECAYARVSTNSEEQKTSYKAQKDYYEQKIKSDENAVFIGIYADEGISGASAKKRSDFLRMINDAKKGLIDKIHVKNISRFARNTLESIQYARELRAMNVVVLFEEENITNMMEKGELLFTILSAVAQEELMNTSEHIKLGLKAKMLNGELVGTQAPYGFIYNKDTKDLIINEKEAKIVRMIFDLRIEGFGCRRIANILNEKGIPSATGNKWVNSTIVRMLKNEKYTGDLVQGKKYTLDPISKKVVINKGEKNLYTVENNHIGIIEKSKFDFVQRIISESAKKFNNDKIGKKINNMYSKYAFTSKIQCGFCGKNFMRRQNNPKTSYKKTSWACDTVIRKGKKECANSLSSINENTLKNIFLDAINCFVEKDKDILNEVLVDVRNLLNDETDSIDYETIERELNTFKSKNSKLLNLYMEDIIDKEEYTSLKEKNDLIIEEKNNILNSVETNSNKLLDLKIQFDEISNLLHNSKLTEFDDMLFRAVVDKIIIGKENEDGSKDKNFINIILNADNSIVFDASLYSKAKKNECTFKNKRIVDNVLEIKSLNVSTERSSERANFTL